MVRTTVDQLDRVQIVNILGIHLVPKRVMVSSETEHVLDAQRRSPGKYQL